VDTKFSTDTVDFLGGKLRITQPLKGYRASSDTVFLAAATPVKPGDRVFELGCGVGTVGLCITTRTPITYVGVDHDESIICLARQNAQNNTDATKCHFFHGCIENLPQDLRTQTFEHVVMNPPYFEGERHTPSSLRRSASHLTHPNLETWFIQGIKRLKPKGTFTLIYPMSSLDRILTTLWGRLGNVTLFPLWSHHDQPAKRVIVQGTKGSRGPLRLLPGMTLHERPLGGYTAQADSILRGSKA